MEARAGQALELMSRFAERTGVTTGGHAGSSRRYLWTDAFAVCNLLGLARATGDCTCAELALELVRRVHHVLGRHRPDDRRTGWLSPDAGPGHPTLGGLRIGKPLPERGEGEPLDPGLEWDRDGQYFHYLTRWMHALDQVARGLSESMFNEWARELAVVAHRAFTTNGARRMVWKMSIDLGRVLVASMGQHDPLDGFVTCRQLDATATAAGNPPLLARQRNDFAGMIEPAVLASDDPLAISGLLINAHRLDRLGGSRDLVAALLAAALVGLRSYVARSDLDLPADRRLAFRELGLAIGMAAALRMLPDGSPQRDALLAALTDHAPLATAIESFWLRPEQRGSDGWLEHADINDVMLATSLLPDGFLDLHAARSPGGDESAVLC